MYIIPVQSFALCWSCQWEIRWRETVERNKAEGSESLCAKIKLSSDPLTPTLCPQIHPLCTLCPPNFSLCIWGNHSCPFFAPLTPPRTFLSTGISTQFIFVSDSGVIRLGADISWWDVNVLISCEQCCYMLMILPGNTMYKPGKYASNKYTQIHAPTGTTNAATAPPLNPVW